jgi:hypothetical protein
MFIVIWRAGFQILREIVGGDHYLLLQVEHMPSTQVLQFDPLVPSELSIAASPRRMRTFVKTLFTSVLSHFGHFSSLGFSFIPFSISKTSAHFAHL